MHWNWPSDVRRHRVAFGVVEPDVQRAQPQDLHVCAQQPGLQERWARYLDEAVRQPIAAHTNRALRLAGLRLSFGRRGVRFRERDTFNRRGRLLQNAQIVWRHCSACSHFFGPILQVFHESGREGKKGSWIHLIPVCKNDALKCLAFRALLERFASTRSAGRPPVSSSRVAQGPRALD